MIKKGLLSYLVPEMLLLCLIEIGKCLGWSVMAVQILMYTAILINTIIVASRYVRLGPDRTKKPDQYLAFALLATAAADIFLTLIGTDAVYLPGVILFCLVQVIYALYLRSGMKLLLIRIALFAVCLLVLKKAGILNLANAMGVLDLSLLLVNMVISWTSANANTPLLFRIGITLFLCCDLFIALRSFTSGGLHDVIDFFVWIFYIPSQAAITLAYLIRTYQKEPVPADDFPNAGLSG